MSGTSTAVPATTTDDERLALDGVTKQFGGLKAVAEISFTLHAQERVGLLGPNGAGKTTLVNCVAGDLRTTTGQVRLGGHDVAGLRPHRLFARGLARTYQVVNPFPALTVLESTAIGALVHGRGVRQAEERAMAALERLGLANWAGTPMGELNIVAMKEVELARIVASGPSVVLLDELLAGLRPTEVDHLLDVIEEICREGGWTVLMIEHLLGAIMRFCTRLLVMNEGRLIADGTPQEVTEDERVVEAYLGAKWRKRA